MIRILCVLVGALSITAASADSLYLLKSEIQNLEMDKIRLESRVSDLESEVSNLSGELSELELRVGELEASGSSGVWDTVKSWFE